MKVRFKFLFSSVNLLSALYKNRIGIEPRPRRSFVT